MDETSVQMDDLEEKMEIDDGVSQKSNAERDGSSADSPSSKADEGGTSRENGERNDESDEDDMVKARRKLVEKVQNSRLDLEWLAMDAVVQKGNIEEWRSVKHSKEYYLEGKYCNERRKTKREQFPLPVPSQRHVIEQEKDFMLPYDIYEMICFTEEAQAIREAGRGVHPAPFVRIRSNVFINRRPRSGWDSDSIPICSCDPIWPSQLAKLKKKKAPIPKGCGEDCINRQLMIECAPEYCPCGKQCTNQRLSKKRWAKTKPIRTPAGDHGLVAMEDISVGDLVIEYVGEVINEEECYARFEEAANEQHQYIINLMQDEYIDASRRGNDARFMNHSCDPNCRSEKWMVNGEYVVGLFAIRDIKAGTELTFDYKFENIGDEADRPCRCGSVNCRGTLGQKPKDRKKGSAVVEQSFLESLASSFIDVKSVVSERCLSVGNIYHDSRTWSSSLPSQFVTVSRNGKERTPVPRTISYRFKIGVSNSGGIRQVTTSLHESTKLFLAPPGAPPARCRVAPFLSRTVLRAQTSVLMGVNSIPLGEGCDSLENLYLSFRPFDDEKDELVIDASETEEETEKRKLAERKEVGSKPTCWCKVCRGRALAHRAMRRKKSGLYNPGRKSLSQVVAMLSERQN